jgi:hypothetical protein
MESTEEKYWLYATLISAALGVVIILGLKQFYTSKKLDRLEKVLIGSYGSIRGQDSMFTDANFTDDNGRIHNLHYRSDGGLVAEILRLQDDNKNWITFSVPSTK